MSQARHAGKIVLTIPATARPGQLAGPAGTVLVTGGTGTLGALTARHLAVTGRAARLVLVSRSGPAAPGASVLAANLAEAGAAVVIVACDAGDREALARVLAGPCGDVPLTGVVHT